MVLCSWQTLYVNVLCALLLRELDVLPVAHARPGRTGHNSGFYLNSCELRRGRCTYRVHLTGQCGANNIPLSSNIVQNDYNERVNDIEKHLTHVKTEHTLRIKNLEKTMSNLVRGAGSTIYHPRPIPATVSEPEVPTPDVERRQYVHRKLGKKFDEDPHRKENLLLNELHATFGELRDNLKRTQLRLSAMERQLFHSHAKLNKTQTDLQDTTTKLLLTERALQEMRHDREHLRGQLVTTQKDYNATHVQLTATRRKVRSQNLDLMKAQRENARLKGDVDELHMLLDQTRRLLSEALRKYHELNVRHEATSIELEVRNEQLIICYRGKTSYSCGFEEPSLCGFVQADNTTDFHDWLQHSGATPSVWTGPKVDHTCGNERGHFMYVEASTRGEGQTAHLISPRYQGMVEQCLEFYYHMYGRDIGTLHVYTQVMHGDEFTPVWRAYGNQGNLWTRASVTIPIRVAKKGYRVIFAAILEYGYLGDIAIDDVRVFDGECYHVMNADEMSEKFNMTFPPPTTPTTTTTTPSP